MRDVVAMTVPRKCGQEVRGVFEVYITSLPGYPDRVQLRRQSDPSASGVHRHVMTYVLEGQVEWSESSRSRVGLDN